MKKVLVIEDDGAVRAGLVTALRRNGFDVIDASQGAMGLELALGQRPNLVLSDVNLPGRNGFDVLKELRARTETAAIPVILMTGEPHKADARYSMESGADDYLQKPFSVAQLLATINARLERQDGIQRALEAQAHEQKRDLLQALMDNLPDHVYFKDVNSRFTRVNQSHAHHLGLSNPDEAIGKCDGDFFPPNQANQKLTDERQLLATGKPIVGLVEQSDVTTDKRWVSSTKVPIYGTDGQVAGLIGISRDITESKKAEEELQRKSAILEAQVNSSIDGILVVDEQNRKVLQNQRFNDLLKIPEAMANNKDDEAQLRWVTQQTRDPDKFIERVNHLYAHRSETSREEIEMKDGTILDRYSTPMFGKNGNYFGRMWTFRDVTERKRMEESLRRSEKHYRSLFENMNDGFCLCRMIFEDGRPRDFVYLAVNEMFVRLTGLKDVTGKRVSEVIPGLRESDPELIEIYGRVATTGKHEKFERYVKALRMWFDIAVYSPEAGLFVAVFDVITERKLAEEKLRESESDLAEGQRIARLGSWQFDFSTNKVRWSDELFRIFGVEKKSFNTYEDFLNCVLPEDRQRVIDVNADAKAGNGSFEIEYRIQTPVGETKTIREIGHSKKDASGKIVGLQGTAQDITERKQAEAERQRMELQLRQSQKLESIGQLAAGIAHEINTPTQYVGDNTRFVRDSFAAVAKVLDSHEALLDAARAGAVTPELVARTEQIFMTSDLAYLREQIPQALTETLEGVSRVSKIVHAMKEFSHPGGKEKTPADLNKAIESTVTVTNNEWKYVADMKLELDPALPFVPCFLGEFNQTILNLIVNAAHAIGDVVKKTPGARGLITIQTKCDGDHVQIRVTDTGTGIPVAARPKIFEPFFTTKEVGKGTGQGLAMVYGSVVSRHGGTVTFETEIGRGTTFIICLPVKAKTEHPAAVSAQEQGKRTA